MQLRIFIFTDLRSSLEIWHQNKVFNQYFIIMWYEKLVQLGRKKIIYQHTPRSKVGYVLNDVYVTWYIAK